MIETNKITLNQSVFQAKGNIVSDMGNEKVMLNVQKGKYYNLGEIGGEIWALIEKNSNINNIVESLMNSFQVDRDQCEEQVISFLEMLLKEGLIEIKD